MIAKKSSLKPLIELMIANSFWGLGFVVTVFALKAMSAPVLIGLRFGLAGLVGMAISYFFLKRSSLDLVREMRNSFPSGFFLAATLLFQTQGLQLSTATKSAFITTLYVLIVPFFSWIWRRQKVTGTHFLAVAVALAGTGLLVQIDRFQLGWGDAFLLANAVMAALHILAVDQATSKIKDAFLFNVGQCLWCAAIALFFIPLKFHFSIADWSWQVSLSLASLAFGSSLIGFFLQVRAQHSLSPSVAAVLFLVEAPMSAFFAYFLLQERLKLEQLFGAGLILLAAGSLAFVSKAPPANEGPSSSIPNR